MSSSRRTAMHLLGLWQPRPAFKRNDQSPGRWVSPRMRGVCERCYQNGRIGCSGVQKRCAATVNTTMLCLVHTHLLHTLSQRNGRQGVRTAWCCRLGVDDLTVVQELFDVAAMRHFDRKHVVLVVHFAVEGISAPLGVACQYDESSECANRTSA